MKTGGILIEIKRSCRIAKYSKRNMRELQMRIRWSVATLLATMMVIPIALAQSGFPGPAGENYIPRLTEIMNVIQSQHMKLWLAGSARNWDLAAFELAQLSDSQAQAARFYSGIPSANIVKLTEPIKAISDAIGAKDKQRFSKAVEDLTESCNACHRSMGRAFIVIQTPPADRPFGNQLFSPQGKK
jgi:hypothetical protein